MEAARKLDQEIAESVLQIIYGGKYISPLKRKRINAFWDFCYATFWSNQNFAEAEKEKFKELIADHFAGVDDPNQKFIELVERAVLAKRYIRRRSSRYITKPIDWLNINFKKGLSGTASWYKELNEQRKTVPHYNEGIAVLANGILDFSKFGRSQQITEYRKHLIKMEQYDLVFLYQNAIIHLLFIA
jgi:hypothetical protein